MSKQTKILHVVARYPPWLGGMEQVVQSLAQAQHDLGMDVGVLTSRSGRPETTLSKQSFPVSRLASFTVANVPIMPNLLPSMWRGGAEAIIHLHISTAYLPEITWLYSRMRQCRYVAHVHLDVPSSGPAGFLLEPYKRVFLSRVLRDADAVIVPTNDYRTLIGEKYGLPSERIHVIQNGTHHRITDGRKTLTSKIHRKRIIFVGRLSIQKNVPLMLSAITTYVNKYDRSVELRIVGDGEKREEIAALVKELAIDDVVLMQGALHGEDLESAYAEADLLLLTSDRESFGLVFIEAMAKALPIVSVDIPAIRNVVTHGVNGLLAVQEPAAIADAMHELLTNDELYATVSGNNLAKSRTFGWQAIASELNFVYDQVSYS